MYVLSGCVSNATGETMNDNLYVLPKNCDYSKISNNSSMSHDCSPKLTDEFFSEYQGILINGPEKIFWSKDVDPGKMVVDPTGNVDGPIKLIVAGFLKLPYVTLGLDGELSNNVILVAVNQKTAHTYSGKMIKFGFSARPVVPGYGESQKGLDVQQYFSIDLVQNLEIPIINATYTVYATLGEYKSNVLTINTVVK